MVILSGNLMGNLVAPGRFYWSLALLGACLGLVWLGAEPVFAQNTGCRINWQAMDLSPEQQSQLHQIDNQWQQTYNRLSPQVRQDTQALRQQLNSPTPNEATVMQLQSRIHSNEETLRQEATKAYLQKNRLLNPAQREEMAGTVKRIMATPVSTGH